MCRCRDAKSGRFKSSTLEAIQRKAERVTSDHELINSWQSSACASHIFTPDVWCMLTICQKEMQTRSRCTSVRQKAAPRFCSWRLTWLAAPSFRSPLRHPCPQSGAVQSCPPALIHPYSVQRPTNVSDDNMAHLIFSAIQHSRHLRPLISIS
jgi:hypothetical protein